MMMDSHNRAKTTTSVSYVLALWFSLVISSAAQTCSQCADPTETPFLTPGPRPGETGYKCEEEVPKADLLTNGESMHLIVFVPKFSFQ